MLHKAATGGSYKKQQWTGVALMATQCSAVSNDSDHSKEQ